MPQQQNQSTAFPPQKQQPPGVERLMHPQPVEDDPDYVASGKLEGKVALITGGDSGIGRAVAILFAKEGADVAIVYLNEHEDAEATRDMVGKYGGRAILLAGDIGDETFCRDAVKRTVDELGGLDILVNHAGEQQVKQSLQDISADQVEHTFRTNVFSMFHLVKAAEPHLKEGSAIINTTSVQAYLGSNAQMIDYAASKGAIVSMTRALAQAMVGKGVRVNGVAPGPVWTPLIPATMPVEKVEHFGEYTPMKRAGQPVEIAPCYLFLACKDSSYITGQVLHPNGGTSVAS